MAFQEFRFRLLGLPNDFRGFRTARFAFENDDEPSPINESHIYQLIYRKDFLVIKRVTDGMISIHYLPNSEEIFRGNLWEYVVYVFSDRVVIGLADFRIFILRIMDDWMTSPCFYDYAAVCHENEISQVYDHDETDYFMESDFEMNEDEGADIQADDLGSQDDYFYDFL